MQQGSLILIAVNSAETERPGGADFLLFPACVASNKAAFHFLFILV